MRKQEKKIINRLFIHYFYIILLANPIRKSFIFIFSENIIKDIK